MTKTEYVDIYDRNKNKTGITKIRHVDTYKDGEYIIGVQLILFNKNNEILITKRSDTKKLLPGKWECNGGAIDAGETPIEGLEREIYEELGWKLEFEYIGISEEFILDMDEKTQFINVIFKATYNEEIKEMTFYGKEGDWATFNWIDLKDLDNIPLHPRRIKDIALGKINHVVNVVE